MQETKDFHSRLYKKERKKKYNTFKLNKVTGNKTFWTTIKRFLSDKETNINKICHVDKHNGISDDKQLCKTLSNFLQEAFKSPDDSENFYTFSYSHSDLVNSTIRKYENHLSV